MDRWSGRLHFNDDRKDWDPQYRSGRHRDPNSDYRLRLVGDQTRGGSVRLHAADLPFAHLLQPLYC